MSSIDLQTIAKHLRLAKNFNLLVDAGIDPETAEAAVRQYGSMQFNDVRVTDDRIIIQYATCVSKHNVVFPIAA